MQQKALKKLNKLQTMKPDLALGVASAFVDVEDSIDEVKGMVQDIAQQMQEVPDVEEKPEVQKIEILGAKILTIKGKDGEKGDSPTDEELIALIEPLIPVVEDGKDYILTEQDKKDIASTITVPVVEKIIEKVIEKVEVIKEQPIITNEIKEVAVTDTPEQIVEKINDLVTDNDDYKIDASHIKNLPKPQVIQGGGSRGVTTLKDGVVVQSVTREINFGNNLTVTEEGNGIRVDATGGSGGSSTYAGLTDATTVDLPTVNTPLATALGTKQPLDAGLTSISGLTGAGYVKATATDTFSQVATIPNTDITGLGTLATQNGTFSGTHSGTSSGTNTGDNAVNSLYSGLVSNATHTGDATGATVLTLATVNANVGSFGLAGSVAKFVVNAKGLITSAVNVAISITASQVSDFTSAVNALITGKANTSTTISTTAPLSGGGDLSANRMLTTSMSTNKLIGRGSAGTGVMEEITLGTNLSLTGNTLNATGGGGGGTPGGANKEVQFNDGGAFNGDTGFEYDKATATLTTPYVTASIVTASNSLQTSGYVSAPDVFGNNIRSSGSNPLTLGTSEATAGIRIETPAFNATTATVGQVLTLVNATTGAVEYQTPSGGSDPLDTVSVITTNTTLSTEEIVAVDSTLGNVTVTLPNAVTNAGKKYLIYKSGGDSNIAEVAAGVSGINGIGGSVELTSVGEINKEYPLFVISNGIYWLIIKRPFDPNDYLKTTDVMSTTSNYGVAGLVIGQNQVRLRGTDTDINPNDNVSGIHYRADAPTTTDDSSAGYATRDLWFQESNRSIWKCEDAFTGVWVIVVHPSNTIRVIHGATAGTARPSATYVEWVGSVEPTNALDGDTWYNT